MKKILSVFALFIFLGGAIFFLTRSKPEAPVTPKAIKKAVVRPIDELPQADRPVVDLSLRSDGREFHLEISQIKNFENVEYDLIYLVAGVQQGFNSTIALKPGQSSISRDLLRGTCSSGKCRYEEGFPTGGTLTLIFRNEKDYKSVQDFTLTKQAGKYIVVME